MAEIPKSFTTIILGAGSSKPYGAPLMQDFLEASLCLTESEEYKADLQRVLEFRSEVVARRTGVGLNARSIEDLFSLASMRHLLSGNDDEGLLRSFRRVIAATVDQSAAPGPLQRQRGCSKVYRHESVSRDRELVFGNHKGPHSDLLKSLGDSEFGFITFNYDCTLEDALLANGLRPKYTEDVDWCPPLGQGYGRALSQRKNISVAKLHGSANWHAVGEDIQILYPDQFLTTAKDWEGSTAEFVTGLAGASGPTYDGKNIPWNVSVRNIGQSDDVLTDYDPLIIPPDWKKDFENPTILKQWVQASEMIKKSDRFIFIGYSLPRSDSYFRTLWMDAMQQSREYVKQVDVVLYDEANQQTRASVDGFRELMDAQLAQVFKPHYTGYEEYVRGLNGGKRPLVIATS